MSGEEREIQKAVGELGKKLGPDSEGSLKEVIDSMTHGGRTPKDLLGLNDQAIEGIYGQAYRLYNTGKYKEASQLFRLLIMLNGTESKYMMGFAACFHMLKEYATAVEVYLVCEMLDPKNPIPHYHASDCYIEMGDKLSAIVALEMTVARCGEKGEYAQMKDRALMTIASLKSQMTQPVEL